MTDTITLKREVVARWIVIVGSIMGCHNWDKEELDALEKLMKAALAAPQPEPQPVKQADKTYTWNDCLQSIIDQGGGPSTPVPQPVQPRQPERRRRRPVE